ncbi:bifunctional 4-hydroxy-2-oxoglutarate aldolase/2-dehydro-3-deoxy-phosphogluconate aldolase [Breoghania sp. L-A4]|uniref:bifunctional 4-hydroxy-2-oxoglutarate aldolase/2-dehydro-3-deoxy-phosphogluconate aldolase n=1 Tax=Breoghania sp. L-A4 TaxID=2304600 RepID=UPI0013C2B137|nr:bifunctional 4-hydroxy-2-oxoglutarate aldolase/2-dehydro-3-deoxy-phosphogluconate aldolase [Breoghania sp. L-A4]
MAWLCAHPHHSRKEHHDLRPACRRIRRPIIPTVSLEDFARARIVPVVRTPTRDQAETAIRVLADCGFRLIEMTLTTPQGEDVIRRFADAEGVVMGAGTVLTSDQARRSIDAGARFLVAPALRPAVADVARDAGIPFFLGAATPSEVLAAHEMGAAGVKIFPAAQLGGPGFLKALRSVYPDIALMPTGGITADNARSYLDAGAICVGMGGKLVDVAALEAGNTDAIVQAARQALAAVS